MPINEFFVVPARQDRRQLVAIAAARLGAGDTAVLSKSGRMNDCKSLKME
jgi:hypothetical protein